MFFALLVFQGSWCLPDTWPSCNCAWSWGSYEANSWSNQYEIEALCTSRDHRGHPPPLQVTAIRNVTSYSTGVSLFQDCKWFKHSMQFIFSFFHPGRIPVGWHPLELPRNFPFDEQSLPIDFVMPSEKARATATETSNSQGWLQSLVNGCKWLVYVSIWDRSKHIQSISYKGCNDHKQVKVKPLSVCYSLLRALQ